MTPPQNRATGWCVAFSSTAATASAPAAHRGLALPRDARYHLSTLLRRSGAWKLLRWGIAAFPGGDTRPRQAALPRSRRRTERGGRVGLLRAAPGRDVPRHQSPDRARPGRNGYEW